MPNPRPKRKEWRPSRSACKAAGDVLIGPGIWPGMEDLLRRALQAAAVIDGVGRRDG